MSRTRRTSASQFNAAPTRWDLLLMVLAGVLLQYVWRIQEIFPVLRYVQFTLAVSGAAVVLFVLDGHPARRLGRLSSSLYRWIIVIFLLTLLSLPTSVHDGASMQFITSNFVKTVVLVAVMAAAIRDRDDVERLVRVFVLGGAGYVLAEIAFSTGGRLGGRGSYDPNDLGLYTVATLPLCIYLMRRNASLVDRLIGLGASGVLLLGTVQSGSRGGFLALVAVAIYGILALDVVRSSKRWGVAVVGAGVLIGAGGSAYWERMRTIFNPQQDYNWAGQAESGRVEVWKRGLGYMVQRPLFGVGVNQFDVAEGTMAPQAQRQQMGQGFKWSAAHSAYVQIGAEVGVLGLITFIVLLAAAFREARRIGRSAASPGDRLLGQAFGGMIVGFAVGAAFLSQAYATYLYFALALLIGFARVVARGPAGAQQLVFSRASAVPVGAQPALRRGGQRGGAAF